MRRQSAVGLDQPWQWPSEFYHAAQTYLVRPFGPTPRRTLPPDPISAGLAEVVATKGELDRLLTDKPPFWGLAAFASSLLQQRNSVVDRLRACAAGYQPRGGTPLTAAAYAGLARAAIQQISAQSKYLVTFMSSPALTAVIHDASTGRGDPDAIVDIAHQLMGYHSNFLGIAEQCLQTPVEHRATVLAYDTSTVTLCPLISYGEFIVTLCHRLAETRETLAYSGGRDISIETTTLAIALPRGLQERIEAQIERFGR